MALAIVLGAFGAHVLESMLTADLLETWKTAVLYHALNSLGLFAIIFTAKLWHISLTTPFWLIFAGIILFSGSLYALCLTGVNLLGAITPLGGVSFISGWMLYAWKVANV